MNTREVVSALLLLAAPIGARIKTDIVVMSNGDKMTGEIKGLGNGVLRIDLDYVDGSIGVQWMKVARVESKQLFIVQTDDGSLHTGTLATVPGSLDRIEVANSQERTQIVQSRIVKLDETSNTFLQRWNGEVSLGLTHSKGNNSTQNSFGSEVEYRRERWNALAAFNSNLSASTGSDTAVRNQVDLAGYRRLPWKNYFYGGMTSFLQSSVQGISGQTTFGGGLGRYIKNTNRARISLLAGAAWQTTKYEPAAVSIAAQQVGAGLVATDMRVFIFKKTNLSLRANVMPSLTNERRVRFNSNASYYLKMFRNLSWNFSFYGNWDTNPPGNFDGSDYGYSAGLKWTFGYR